MILVIKHLKKKICVKNKINREFFLLKYFSYF